jgi:hypothetical protein
MAWPFDDQPITPQTTASSLPAFPWLVATNPHGWGNAPPQPQQSQGPELRPHDPSIGESAYSGLNDFGRWLGPYPDLGQRTLDTLNLLSLPSLLSLMGPGATALKASDAAAPLMARVYRGSPIEEGWAPEGALRNPTFWASDNPEVANTYAGVRGVGPNVMPADVSFTNPLVVDAGGREWTGVPFGSGTKATDTLANLARMFGHDGLVVKNVRDSVAGGPLGTTYAALRPGTVKSALTGAPIYSLLAALAGQQLPGGEPPASQR